MTWLTGHRRTAAAILAAATLLLAAGCGGDDPKSDPTPTTPAPSTSTSPTKPAWAAKYTDAQYADFQRAQARYLDWFNKHQSAWLRAQPKAAIPVAREYFTPKEGTYQLHLIRFWKEHKSTADKPARIVWMHLTDYGKTVEGQPQLLIQQCTDFAAVQSYQNGKPLKHKTWKTPVIFTVTLGRTPRGKWMISRILNPGIDDVKAQPCHAE